MIKATRIAVAAVFGVAATLPAFADFDNNGPSDQQGQHIMKSTDETNPPALDSRSPVVAESSVTDRSLYQGPDGRIYERTDTRVYPDQPVVVAPVPTDRDYIVAENRDEARFDRFYHRYDDERVPNAHDNAGGAAPGRMGTWERSAD